MYFVQQMILRHKGVTLIELITVVIILGILASFAIPGYMKVKEHALGNEAKANLKIIAAAEKVYHMELNTYYPVTGLEVTSSSEISTNLKLNLNEASWDYYINGNGTTDGTAFAAYAQRQNACTGVYCDCLYTIDSSNIDGEPTVSVGVCP